MRPFPPHSTCTANLTTQDALEVCTLTKTGLAFKHPEKYLYTGFLKNPNKENKNCATIQPRKTLKSPCLDPEP